MTGEATPDRSAIGDAAFGPGTRLAPDHGGNLDAAVQKYGGKPENWIDLSTGINRRAYPLFDIPPGVWHRLPTLTDIDRLVAAARKTYRTRAAILPLAGAQAAIQLVPRLIPARRAAVLAPTYNEHKTCLEREGWTVGEVSTLDGISGFDLAVVVNPNNPDGRFHTMAQLREAARHVRLLVVDESFVDATPELSLATDSDVPGILVLRSFGKFYGLAGLRLGFAIGADETISRLSRMAGPWQVSGPAIEIGMRALADDGWQREAVARLAADAERMDACAVTAGWECAGGTLLFRLYRTDHAATVQALLARHRIWSRIFPWSANLVRLGLPGCEAEWSRLEAALLDVDG